MKKNLILVYGGKSVEHEVSIRSAANVFAHLNTEKYRVILIGITKEGHWHLTEKITEEIAAGPSISLSMDPSNPCLVYENKKLKIDIVFPVVHGADGEDGGIQGIFKVLNVPVTGSDVLGSSVAMDKIVSKQLWAQAGLPIARFKALTREELLKTNFSELSNFLGKPFMLKAGNLGSSVGISKVSNEESFDVAVKESLKYSNIVLIESFVKGRELECAVLGNDKVETTYPGEITLKKDYDFYTYQAKYEDEDAIEISIPASVGDEVSQKIRQYCAEAFKVAQCKDYGRVDLFLTDENQVIVNEINTIPGFTDVSMFPMLWKQMGLSYPDLIDKIIDLCLERHSKVKELSTNISD